MKIYFVKCGDMYLVDLNFGTIGSVILNNGMTGAEIFTDLSTAQRWADKTGGVVETFEKSAD